MVLDPGDVRSNNRRVTSNFLKSFRTNDVDSTNQSRQTTLSYQAYVSCTLLSITSELSLPARKPTLRTPISLSMLRKLTRIDTFRLLLISCFRNHYSIPLSPWDGMCRPGSVCADWYGSIHYAEVIFLNLLYYCMRHCPFPTCRSICITWLLKEIVAKENIAHYDQFLMLA